MSPALLLVAIFALAAAQPCSVAVPSEQALLEAAGLSCTNGAECAVAPSGSCHVVALTAGFALESPLSLSTGALGFPFATHARAIVLLDCGRNATSVDFGSLVTAHSLWIAFNDGMTRIDLHSLTSVADVVDVTDNSALVAMSAPRLLSVGGRLLINNNAGLTTLSLPALQSTGGPLYLSNMLSLTQLALPSLHHTGADLSVSGCVQLQSVSLPALRFVNGPLVCATNAVLSSLSMPRLNATAAYLYIVDNPALQNASMASLQVVGQELYVGGNAQLRIVDWSALRVVCAAKAAAIALEAQPAYVLCSTVSGGKCGAFPMPPRVTAPAKCSR